MATRTLVKAGTTSKIVEVTVRDSTTGQGKTGLAHGSVTASYVREGGTRVAITLASGSPGDAYSSGKWAEVDSTNQKGVYQLHVPNAAIAAGVAAVKITFQASGAIDKSVDFEMPEADLLAANLPANLVQIGGDSQSGTDLKDFADTGYDPATHKVQGLVLADTVTTLTQLTVALTEGYRGTGATGSVRDLLYEILAHLGEFSIVGTTKTLKKLDGSTTAKTLTLNSSTAPTSITETT